MANVKTNSRVSDAIGHPVAISLVAPGRKDPRLWVLGIETIRKWKMDHDIDSSELGSCFQVLIFAQGNETKIAIYSMLESWVRCVFNLQSL